MNIQSFITAMEANDELTTFVKDLTEILSEDQLHGILEAVSQKLHDEGYCPFCGCEDYPIDVAGKEIEGDDVSGAVEWCEVHSEDCPVTLIEASFTKEKKE
jgi:hypothetical protein